MGTMISVLEIIFILIWGALSVILFFKIWGMTSDVSEIKKMFQQYLLASMPPKSNAAKNFDTDLKITQEEVYNKLKGICQGDIIESPKYGTLKYNGIKNGKHALYPVAGQDLTSSSFCQHDSFGYYLAVTDNEFASLL